jgi:DNA-binding MarR family transcriptional regulator
MSPPAALEHWPLSRLLITASRLVEHDIAVELRPYQLTHASFGVLALVHNAPMSQRELARTTRVEEQTISQTIDRLERMGMVTRERDPHDRRRFLVTASDQGTAVFREATRQDRAEQALEGLPEAGHLRLALAALIRRLGGEDYVPAVEPE